MRALERKKNAFRMRQQQKEDSLHFISSTANPPTPTPQQSDLEL